GTKEGAGVLFIRNIPVSPKRRFKAYCARQEVSMTEKILEIIEDKLNRLPSEWREIMTVIYVALIGYALALLRIAFLLRRFDGKLRHLRWRIELLERSRYCGDVLRSRYLRFPVEEESQPEIE